MAEDNAIEYYDAFKAIKLNDRRLQLFHCWCKETGLTCFHNSFTALKQWLESVEDEVTAVYLLPTVRDAEIALSHLEADSALAPLVTKADPAAKRVLVSSCQQWVGEELVGKTLAVRNLIIVVDLGVGIVSSYVSAMSTALFTELQHRDDSRLRTFSIMALQRVPLPNTIGNYLFDINVVSHTVSSRGWQVVAYNTRTGSDPKLTIEHRPPGCRLKDNGFDEAQLANALAVLEEEFQRAESHELANEAYKVVVLMSRERFRRLVKAVTSAKTRSLFIDDRTPTGVVQAMCEDEEPGLTVVGITTTGLCVMPRVKGLRVLIADNAADRPAFDATVGHSITREMDAAYARDAQLFDIGFGVDGLVACRLWDMSTHQPTRPVLFPAHDTGEMYHLIIRLADICPGQDLNEVPYLHAQREPLVLQERLRRLELWGVVERTGAGVKLTDGKGRLVSGLAHHEDNIHSLILLAGAADPSLGLSAQARHFLVWLAAVIAHDPEYILVNPEDLTLGILSGSPADNVAQVGIIWAAFLGVRIFSSPSLVDEEEETQMVAVEPAEARQVVDSATFWVEKLSLPAVSPDTAFEGDIGPHDKAVVRQQLVSAFIYNIAMLDVRTRRLVDLLSDTELCLGEDAMAQMVAAGQGVGEPVVFAIYTDLRRSAQGISPRNLTLVSHETVLDEMVKIAPRPGAQPGTSPIDLATLRPMTAPPVALEPAPAPPEPDWVEGEVEPRILD